MATPTSHKAVTEAFLLSIEQSLITLTGGNGTTDLISGFNRNINAETSLATGLLTGETLTVLGSAEQLQIASSDVTDTGGDVGALTVVLVYIDNAGAENTEIISLSGTTPVNIGSSTGFGVNNLVVLTAGSNLTNVGNLYVGPSSATWTVGKPDVIIDVVEAGCGLKQSCVHYVPAGTSLSLTNFFATSTMVGSDTAEMKMVVYQGLPPTTTKIVITPLGASHDINTSIQGFPALVGPAAILVNAVRTQGNGTVACSVILSGKNV